jgi:hypothetical protein
MKIVAKYPVQLGGHVFRKGEATDFDGEVTPRIAANFVNADGTALVAPENKRECGEEAHDEGAIGTEGQEGEKQPTPEEIAAAEAREKADAEAKLVATTIKSLKKEGLQRKLDEMGVTYPADAKVEFLARLYLMAQGELKA